ncbi:MAG: Uncharacterised protein [Methanobacteriota archaeon]|nr:MAG: Uncharacterised protein [Euryarchaeota archaeon]
MLISPIFDDARSRPLPMLSMALRPASCALSAAVPSTLVVVETTSLATSLTRSFRVGAMPYSAPLQDGH